MEFEEIKENVNRVRENIETVLIGKRNVIELLLTGLLANGNILLEDVPGTGKTMLAKSLARSIQGACSRIQFTADLLPSDVTGLHFYNQKAAEFVLQKGPVFTNILLADEINRATPRTQSSLLECMEEKQVTLDGETLPLEDVFFVIATENPVETVGTFSLPEAQLDRFMMKLSMGFPTAEEELQLLERFALAHPYETLKPVLSLDTIVEMQKKIREVYVSRDVKKYMVSIVEATRTNAQIRFGVSPRGTLALFRASQAYAAMAGRAYVIPEDVKYLAPFVLEHRLVIAGGYGENRAKSGMLAGLLERIPVPTEQFAEHRD